MVALPFCYIQLTGRKPPNTAYPQQLKTLGDHLRKRRLDLRLLQKEVAKNIGVNKSTITNWELNHNFPELRYIPSIIDFLGYWPNDTPGENLGQQIVAKRTRLGISQKELAQQLCVNPSSLGRWEQDIGKPSQDNYRKVIGFLSN